MLTGRTAWEWYDGKLVWYDGKLAWWWLCGTLVLEWYDDGNWELSSCGKSVLDGGPASGLRCGGSQHAGSWRSGAYGDGKAAPLLQSIHHLRRCRSDARRPDHRRSRRRSRSLHRRCRSRGLWEMK